MTPQPSPAKPQALQLFMQAIWRHKLIFIEALIGTVVLNLIGLATSLYSMQVYDRVIPNAGLSTLWVLTVGVLMAMVLELVLKHVRTSMVDKACKAIDLDLSDRFFGHALRIRMPCHHRHVCRADPPVRVGAPVPHGHDLVRAG
jgi:ATP-binding cassette subfamily C protein LapB